MEYSLVNARDDFLRDIVCLALERVARHPDGERALILGPCGLSAVYSQEGRLRLLDSTI